MPSAHANIFDFLIVGGGTAGCVVASRLAEFLPQSRILLIEAGPSDFMDDRVLMLKDWLSLLGGKLDYDYGTTEQPQGMTSSGFSAIISAFSSPVSADRVQGTPTSVIRGRRFWVDVLPTIHSSHLGPWNMTASFGSLSVAKVGHLMFSCEFLIISVIPFSPYTDDIGINSAKTG
jgi:GMC oxidoreductase